MLEKVRDLVFGLGPYEKTRLDERFSILSSLLSRIVLENPQDYEVLESCIYKIKDQLRLKSSNLNKAIASSQQELRKKDVEFVLSQLMNIKKEFVNEAFSIKDEIKRENKEEKKEELKENLEVLEESLSLQEKKVEKKIELLKTQEFEIFFENRKLPLLRILFFKDLDLVFLKRVSSLLFDSYPCEGSNLFIEGNEALLVLRRKDDEIFDLPRISIDLEDVYKQLQISQNPQIQEGEYKEIKESKKETIQSHKKEEDSLDSLLNSLEEKKTPHDPVISNTQEEKKEELSIEKEEEVLSLEKEEKKAIEDTLESFEKVTETYLIYEDEQLFVYIKEDSKILGELIIESKSRKKQEELSETEMTYMLVFSKIFASILFEVLQAQGTNIIWERKSSQLRILPRFQNDNLHLQWKAQQHNDSFLEQIQKKLHTTLAQGVSEEHKEKGRVFHEGEGEAIEKKESTGIKSGVPKFEELFKPERIDKNKEDKLNFIKKCIMSMP